VIDALLLNGGAVGTSRWVATHLGLPNRFSLARLLRDDGLPPLHRLSGWIAVLRWVSEWERANVSLSRSALRTGREPTECSRLVKRITGAPWVDVRAAGVNWALARFVEECGGRM